MRDDTSDGPRILQRKVEFTTPWFAVVAKRLPAEAAPYYSLQMQDYVAVVALTREREIILVRQYRPAIERLTLELPSGHVERNEMPAESARRELAEECGFEAGRMEPLGPLLSDTGRNQNRLWCFLAPEAMPQAGYVPEAGIERVLVPQGKLPEMLVEGQFDHALHLAALMLAVAKYPGVCLANLR